jgi:hypothetical protein
MSCRSEDLPTGRAIQVFEELQNQGLKLRKEYRLHGGEENLTISELKMGRTNLWLKFILKENGYEMLFTRTFYTRDMRITIMYRSDETQIETYRGGNPNFSVDLANVEMFGENTIIFDEYIGQGGLQNEIKSERDFRRNDPSNLVEEQKLMDFNEKMLELRLKDYFRDDCIEQYFANNNFILT